MDDDFTQFEHESWQRAAAVTAGAVAAGLRAARTLRTAKRRQDSTYTIAPPQLEPAPAVQPKQ
jgi:hypothetical protein